LTGHGQPPEKMSIGVQPTNLSDEELKETNPHHCRYSYKLISSYKHMSGYWFQQKQKMYSA